MGGAKDSGEYRSPSKLMGLNPMLAESIHDTLSDLKSLVVRGSILPELGTETSMEPSADKVYVSPAVSPQGPAGPSAEMTESRTPSKSMGIRPVLVDNFRSDDAAAEPSAQPERKKVAPAPKRTRSSAKLKPAGKKSR